MNHLKIRATRFINTNTNFVWSHKIYFSAPSSCHNREFQNF